MKAQKRSYMILFGVVILLYIFFVFVEPIAFHHAKWISEAEMVRMMDQKEFSLVRFDPNSPYIVGEAAHNVSYISRNSYNLESLKLYNIAIVSSVKCTIILSLSIIFGFYFFWLGFLRDYIKTIGDGGPKKTDFIMSTPSKPVVNEPVVKHVPQSTVSPATKERKPAAPPKPTQAKKPQKPQMNQQRTAAKPPKKQKQEKAPVAAKPITFDDIAGYQQTKESLQFLVTCLKNQEKLEQIGSKMPKGVLLYGPPGTGKTLIGKAIASTAGVPFLYASGSQFMEIYVGQGAKNIRDLYEQARQNAPCVVYIDEIDAIGCSREGSQNDSERKHTLDALLVELDGINQNNGILTIAATNLVSELDAALTRPGRFDRKIAVPLPNRDDRLAILKVHAKGKKLSGDVDLNALACMTVGYSGAGLASIMNESGIIALQNNRTVITKQDVEKAFMESAVQGEVKKNSDKRSRKVVAVHEAGHALAMKVIQGKKVSHVTILGSTSGVGGVTFGSSDAEMPFPTKADMEARICVMYAGRAAEELIFGSENITAGAANDIQQATRMIRNLITKFGMHEQIGLLDMDALMGTRVNSAISEDVVSQARDLSNALYQKTLQCLKDNLHALHRITKELLEKESLNDDDLNKLLKK